MTMGSVARDERRVLKLVHPGGFVEIHRNPVAASQVMEKNPRHFVTRPDVFKFPWLVVWPESVLKPGSIFYIVPCHTLYRLLRNSRSPPNRAAMMAATPIGSWAEAGAKAMCSDVGMFEDRKPAQAKSCLKKQSCGNSKKSRGLRVVFNIPDDRKVF